MDESVIREMTRVAEDCDAVNLAQGFPEFPVAETVLDAAHRALREGRHRYTRTWGDPRLRAEVARFLATRWDLRFDPETEVVITCGASEAIVAALLALLAPGDIAVVPEPIYENYLPGIRLAGAEPAILSIDPFTGRWDPGALERELSRARVMILNTPANPIGKVWSREELEEIARMFERSDAVLITDETYAFITDPQQTHVPPATVGSLAPRTVTIVSFSKTYGVTVSKQESDWSIFLDLGNTINVEPGAIDVIDTQLLENVRTIDVPGGIHNIYVMPDGAHVIAGSIGGRRLTVLDTTTDEEVWAWEGEAIRPVAFNTKPDGSVDKLFIQVSGHHGFVVFDWDTRREIDRIMLPDVPPEDRYDSHYNGAPAHGIGVAPDGETLWSTSRMNSYVYVYSIPELELVASIPTGTDPDWITFTPDSRLAYVANAVSNTVSVIDMETYQEVTRIPVGKGPKRNGIIRLPDNSH